MHMVQAHCFSGCVLLAMSCRVHCEHVKMFTVIVDSLICWLVKILVCQATILKCKAMTMTITIHLLSGIAAHRTYDYIHYIHIENNRAIDRLHTCYFKSIKVYFKDKALDREQFWLIRWILLWIMPTVQDQSLHLLTSSPARYYCATDVPGMLVD